jgi:spermidine/putrescine transport system permease protein
LANDQYAAGFANSLIVGIGSAALATLLGFFSAYGVARFAFRFKGLVQWLLLAPSMLSFLIIGLGLLVFFKRVGIEPSLAAVIIGHVVINLPVAFAVILAQTGPHQVNAERAARDLGAREWQVLSLVTAPMLKPSIIAAFGLCLSFSWDEFIISFLLTRFDVTLPVAMWASLRGGLSPAVNAAGTLLFLASLIVFVALIMRGLTNRETRLAG